MTNMTEQAIQSLATMEAERMRAERAARNEAEPKWMKIARIVLSTLMTALSIEGIIIYVVLVMLYGA